MKRELFPGREERLQVSILFTELQVFDFEKGPASTGAELACCRGIPLKKFPMWAEKTGNTLLVWRLVYCRCFHSCRMH